MEYILLVGVHGVGKTTLLENLKKDMRFVALSISDLIRQAGNKIQSFDKFTKNITNNQELWKQELIESFQDSEENQVLEFSRLKNIPIIIYDNDSKLDELKNLLNG